MTRVTYGTGVAEDPWVLKTPPQTSEFHVWQALDADPPQLVVQVGKTRLSYQLRAIEDAAAMLRAHGGWMPLGNADEGKATAAGSLEHWARDPANPVGGFYGLRKGYRGRFANYVAPVLEMLGLAELDHKPRAGNIRALD